MNAAISEAQVHAYHYLHPQLVLTSDSFPLITDNAAACSSTFTSTSNSITPRHPQISPQGGIDPSLIHRASRETTPNLILPDTSTGQIITGQASAYVNLDYNPFLHTQAYPPFANSSFWQYPQGFHLTSSIAPPNTSTPAAQAAPRRRKPNALPRPHQSRAKAPTQPTDAATVEGDDLVLPSPYVRSTPADTAVLDSTPIQRPPSNKFTIVSAATPRPTSEAYDLALQQLSDLASEVIWTSPPSSAASSTSPSNEGIVTSMGQKKKKGKPRLTDSFIHLYHQKMECARRADLQRTGVIASGGKMDVADRRKSTGGAIAGGTESTASPPKAPESLAQVVLLDQPKLLTKKRAPKRQSAPAVMPLAVAVPAAPASPPVLDDSVRPVDLPAPTPKSNPKIPTKRKSGVRPRSSSTSSSEIHDVMDLGTKKRRVMISRRESRASVPREAVEGRHSPFGEGAQAEMEARRGADGDGDGPGEGEGSAGTVPPPRKQKKQRKSGEEGKTSKKVEECHTKRGRRVEAHDTMASDGSRTNNDHTSMMSDGDPLSVEMAIRFSSSSVMTHVDQTEERADSESEIDELLPSSPAPYFDAGTQEDHRDDGWNENGTLDQLQTPALPIASLPPQAASSSPVARLKASYRKSLPDRQSPARKTKRSEVDATIASRVAATVPVHGDLTSGEGAIISIGLIPAIENVPATPMNYVEGLSGMVSGKKGKKMRLGPGWVTKTPLPASRQV